MINDEKEIFEPIIVGSKRNLLTVKEFKYIDKKFKTGTVRKIKEALCECECGREKWIRYEHVNNGHVKSCGCLNYAKRSLDPITKSVRRVFRYTRQSAKVRQLEFSISLEDVRSIIFRPCYYCGALPTPFISNKIPTYGHEYCPYNGIDRIDSLIGYHLYNLVPCCTQCNTAKLDMSLQEFKNHVSKIYAKFCLNQDESKPVKILKQRMWKYYNGSVILDDYMGDDLSVVNAARVSFNKQSFNLTAKDEKLIKYLADHKHMSPFRHVQFRIILQEIPEFILRQLFKHQVGISYTAGDFREAATVWNEMSGRYVELGMNFFEPVSFRMQDENNKQASNKNNVVPNEDKIRTLYRESIENSWKYYNQFLDMGLCKEQARMVIPLAFNTSVVWTASLEALINFVKLRTHKGAQVEIQTLAQIIEEIIRSICPISCNAILSADN